MQGSVRVAYAGSLVGSNNSIGTFYLDGTVGAAYAARTLYAEGSI